MKAKVILSTIVASALALSANASTQTQDMNSAKNSAIVKAQKNAVAAQKELIQEALDSLEFTHKALVDLSNNKQKSAKVNIQKALGKLEAILSSDKAPKLLPIKNDVKVIEYIGDKQSIEVKVDEVKELIKHNKLQEARALLNTLQSEIDVTVVSLPLASYPSALRLASKYIYANKIKEAKKVLELALSTFDTTVEVIPVPLVKAIDLSHVASMLAKKGEKQKAITYLESAKNELSIAESLGYLSSSDETYKTLNDAIDAIEKEIRGKNKAEKLFDELKSKLVDFKSKIFSNEGK